MNNFRLNPVLHWIIIISFKCSNFKPNRSKNTERSKYTDDIGECLIYLFLKIVLPSFRRMSANHFVNDCLWNFNVLRHLARVNSSSYERVLLWSSNLIFLIFSQLIGIWLVDLLFMFPIITSKSYLYGCHCTDGYSHETILNNNLNLRWYFLIYHVFNILLLLSFYLRTYWLVYFPLLHIDILVEIAILIYFLYNRVRLFV